MKKVYILPNVEMVPFAPEIMDVLLVSVKLKGSVDETTDTNWGFGGDSQEDDTPDAKSGNLWDAWDD